MTLKVELKPGERIVVGRSVITNGAQRASLAIAGSEPVLRERDIIQEAQADTPAKRIYYAVQLMYLREASNGVEQVCADLMRETGQAAPSMQPILSRMLNNILTGALYKALRDAKALVAHERGILDHASGSSGLPDDRAANRKPA